MFRPVDAFEPTSVLSCDAAGDSLFWPCPCTRKVTETTMISLVYLTDMAPSAMATELTLAGHSVWEALSVSEVLHLCEQQRIDAVVVAEGVREDLSAIETHHITIRLKHQATTADLMWELSQLFKSGDTAVH